MPTNQVSKRRPNIAEAVQQGCHPVLDAGSPIVDMARRYRIGVRYDCLIVKFSIEHPFWTASQSTKRFATVQRWVPLRPKKATIHFFTIFK